MNAVFLVLSGALGVLIALIHGYLGEVKVVRPAEIHSASAKRVMHAVMFLSAVYWLAASVLLMIAPVLFPETGQFAVAVGAAAVFLTGSIANFWATRGRHIGWVLLAIAAVLALLAL